MLQVASSLLMQYVQSSWYYHVNKWISFSQIFFLSNQNADLKKQLHELQAKITALSEKQVGKGGDIFLTLCSKDMCAWSF